ncbi:MAG: hypothetical protein KY475_27315 [Planctomycetes bacterium]|nr:hypothetical protein [Planctomycetota bacterium]
MTTKYLFVSFGWAVSTSIGAMLEAGPPTDVRVQIASPKEVYQLGEPVRLNVTVTTTQRTPIRFIEVFNHEIEVYLSDNGERFRRWRSGLYPVLDVERKTETLTGGQPSDYNVRVLYDAQRESRLAFEKPGRYWLRAEFPLAENEPPYHKSNVDSNTIRIRIQEPQGEDAEVWRRIREDESFLVLLQTGSSHKDTVLEAAALLKSRPDTAYDSAIRRALKQYDHGYTVGAKKLDEHEAELLRSVLGIELPAPQPFPEDKRLDQIITYRFPKQTPLEEVFREISRQSGVPLKVDPSFREATMASLRVAVPLRRFMRSRAAYKAEWVRQGDAYLLRATEDPKRPKD